MSARTDGPRTTAAWRVVREQAPYGDVLVVQVGEDARLRLPTRADIDELIDALAMVRDVVFPPVEPRRG